MDRYPEGYGEPMDDGERPGAAAAGRGSDGWVPQKDLPPKIQVLLASRLPWRRRRGMHLSMDWIAEHRFPPRAG